MLIPIFIVILAGAFLTGLSKGGLGGGLGALVTPLIALVVPAPLAIGLALPLLISGDICALYAHWRTWDARIIVAVLPASVLGILIGTLIFTSVSPVALEHVLGIVALLYAAYKLWERRSSASGNTLPQRW